jgi:hypothetical protein
MAKEIAINSHESLLYQHKTKPLTYAVWGDNNFVKTLSNFHSPVLLREGMKRKRRNPRTKIREREFSDVDCPTQQVSYCSTYHLIDKGNGAEAKYDISTESHLHGWGPKLAACCFNMNTNNAYKVYCCLYKMYHPGRDPMKLKDCINNLTHSLLQQGPTMRQRGVGAPPSATKNLETSCSGEGRSIRSNAKQQPCASSTAGTVLCATYNTTTPRTPIASMSVRSLYYQQAAYSRMKNGQPWRNHISVLVIVSGSGRSCQWDKCPGIKIKNKIKGAYQSSYQCEQCTMEKGCDFWLCYSTKKVDGTHIVFDCHTRYHVEKKLLSPPTGSATECSVISDLIDES